ncbi:GTP 3',8-cyclase MoaA [Listeria booriae]|uniref:GTP 3',8-cyclase n=1 Tax=Listeria booriae TaxID=1552123 RepID=A0A7X0WCY9_9LIST|nr:GTP 3',8-cyclase MoaA [Listeria booriae]MBC1210120.1 GTP 3',8-cyclase MoaA [Listeria booriae]MBC1232492.1 GTP 3',8-cyclase MoaA [Listeria booriae]MBC1246521.1 GTP 3',8-cyclase MoaA [Listeria booriae]MBC1284491.1 GTP 3',8-cyclase MoaA [Listeria booriae]MBC1315366.1 GTP 3',8-cyclase MoaA [Listeria booriae]
MPLLTDRFGRVHDYIRISVTDRCNLRCVYCMPEEGMTFLPHEEVLSKDEIIDFMKIMVGYGIKKVRITGGEPLLRTDIVDIIAGLSAIPEIEDIAVTTNAMYLVKKADALKEAGLTRVNISLDSLQEDRFKTITRGGRLQKVLDGIAKAEEVGFFPIKLNVVLIKGQNDDEILDFLEFTRDKDINIRFIEYMPIGHAGDSWKKQYLSLQTIFDACDEAGFAYQPVDSIRGNGPSENFRLEGAKGTFGLIHPVSSHFCASCNRLRLTADGYIKACLYWDEEMNIRPLIKDPEKLMELVQQSIDNKPESHEMAIALQDEMQSHKPTTRRMSQIGG